MEQLAARWAHNPKVGGSSPPPATKVYIAKTVTVLVIFLTSRKTPSYAGGLGKLIVLPRVIKIPTPI